MQELGTISSQLTLSSSTLLMFLGAALLLVMGLLFLVASQKRQIQNLKTAEPKFGFLGKPLASIALLAVFATGGGIVWYGSNTSSSFNTANASKDVTLNISAREIRDMGETVEVRFQVVPTVVSSEWGGSDEFKMDAFWLVTGEQMFSEVEFDLSQSKPGGFTEVVKKGSYELKVDAIFEDGKVTQTKSVTF